MREGLGGDNYAHKDLSHGKLERVLGTASSEGKPLAPPPTLVLHMYWNMYLDFRNPQ